LNDIRSGHVQDREAVIIFFFCGDRGRMQTEEKAQDDDGNFLKDEGGNICTTGSGTYHPSSVDDYLEWNARAGMLALLSS